MRMKGFVRRLMNITKTARVIHDDSPQTLLAPNSGDPISARSELLSNASPVFEKLIKEQTKEINMRAYSRDTLRILLTILSGERVEYEMTLKYFREMHGLVREYQLRTVHQNLLAWLQTRVQRIARLPELDNVFPLLQEVAYVAECDPDCAELPALFLQFIEPHSATKAAVLHRVLLHIDTCTHPEILLTLQLTDHTTIAKQLLHTLPKNTPLHDNQTFLLLHLDLLLCLQEDQDLFEEIFSKLLANETLSDDHEIQFLRLQTECYKNYQVEDDICLTDYLQELGLGGAITPAALVEETM